VSRLLLLAPVLAAAALLAAAPVAAAGEAVPHAAEIEFSLPASNGLQAHIANYEKIDLEIKDKDSFVTYEAEGEATDAGLKVRYGNLGSIDITFEPTKTLLLEKPPKGCKGKPSTVREGFYVGTIDFTGEREYVRIETTQAKGTMGVWRESEWRCPHRKGPTRFRHAPRRSVSSPWKRAGRKRETATLAALSYRCRCFLLATAVRGGKERDRSAFVGAKFEETEGVEITRGTFAEAGASAFSFNHKAGTARLRPPAPFSGGGFFKRRPHRRDFWKSTIRVPLLGADPLDFGEPGYRAKLVRELPGGE
jgi:hypothetical protein